MSAIKQAMYRKYAKYYDLIYWQKGYKSEAKNIVRLVKKYKESDGNTLLEFACGTGKHMQYLAKKFRCTGVDINKGMLSIARKLVPGAVFRQGSMISARLGRKFDVVLCLFSSIGYVRTYANLRRTINNFARHLKKGGVVIIEPWFAPKAYKTGTIHMQTYDSPDIKIARLNVSEKKGMVAKMDMHFVVAEKNRNTVHFVDRHELGLFDTRKTLRIIKKAGIKAKFLRYPIRYPKIKRGAFVGVRE